VIKRIRFATRTSGVSLDEFCAAWRDAVAGAAKAPPGVRPSRVAVCIALPDLADPRHDGIGVEWFADGGHLQRFRDWLDTPDGHLLLHRADRIIDRDASPVIVADESVLRGAGWLERRWRDGGEKLKHMAIALRAAELSPAEFSARWRSHAGLLRRSADVTVIPDDARGRAYVQNHPSPRPVGEWAYDALNEVYFDDAEGLRARIDWFRANPPGTADLFRQSWFIAAREEVLA
jgi:EthD domain